MDRFDLWQDKITFGTKCVGMTFIRLVQTDPNYAKWLATKSTWFKRARPDHWRLLNDWVESSDVVCPVQHNSMQEMFNDDLYRKEICYQVLFGKYGPDALPDKFEQIDVIDYQFEHACDVWMRMRCFDKRQNQQLEFGIFVECKTYIDNDYFKVVHQLNRQKYCHIENGFHQRGIYAQVLVVKPDGFAMDSLGNFELAVRNQGTTIIVEPEWLPPSPMQTIVLWEIEMRIERQREEKRNETTN